MLAAWEGTIPVGYCIVRWPHPHRDERTPQAARLECAELADLFVAEDRRRRGAGRMLVEAAEALAEGRGACAIGLEVTAANPENEAARRLYAALGYEDAGLGEFVSGYSYWTPDGVEHRDEELHCYLIKRLVR